MVLRDTRSVARCLSPTQLASIRTVMQGFVEDDVARGVSPTARRFCDACEGPSSMLGCLAYERYLLCNLCATAYELAQAAGCVQSPGCFVRDKRCAETEVYALPTP
jgi:hypothetical protein